MPKHRLKKKNSTVIKKLSVIAIAFTLLSVGSVATVSGFTDSGSSAITTKAGTVSITANGVASTTIAFGNLLNPGDTSPTQTVTVQNTGNLPLTFDIQTATSPAPGSLATVLDVTITPGAYAVYTSKLKVVNTPNYTLAAGASMTVTFVAKWVLTGTSDDTYQGTSGTATLNFLATQ